MESRMLSRSVFISILLAGCGPSTTASSSRSSPSPPPQKEWFVKGAPSCKGPTDPERDPTVKQQMLQCGCQQNDKTSCAELADDAIKRRTPDAESRARHACGLGDARSCYNVAAVLEERKAPNDEWLQKACTLQYPVACKFLEYRRAFERKDVTALGRMCRAEKHREACAAAAQFLVQKGTDVSQAAELVQLCEIGCQLNHDGICVMYGELILQLPAASTKKTPEDAVALFKAACANRYAIGCTRLGTATVNGKGVTRDMTEAGRLFKSGCDLGDGTGCANLAVLHTKGLGVARDAKLAAELREKACKLGDKTACK
jgi:uncharacterized protein